MQENIQLSCTQCKRKNYATTKNKRTVTARLELKRYCRWCRAHVLHKEVK